MDIRTIISIIIIAIVLILIAIYLLTNQKKRVMDWLIYAVSIAEKQLGEKTGQLKLGLVYDWFIGKFPIFATICPQKVFDAWVDVALKTMREWLKSKNKISEYILNKPSDE